MANTLNQRTLSFHRRRAPTRLHRQSARHRRDYPSKSQERTIRDGGETRGCVVERGAETE